MSQQPLQILKSTCEGVQQGSNAVQLANYNIEQSPASFEHIGNETSDPRLHICMTHTDFTNESKMNESGLPHQ